MTYNGAAGTTEAAMRSTLELDSMSVADVNVAYRGLIEMLRNLDPHVRFQIANSIWYKQGYTIEQPFLAANHDYYDAQVTALDFTSPTAPATINNWVSQQTHGLIDHIVDAIPDYMRLYLIDASRETGLNSSIRSRPSRGRSGSMTARRWTWRRWPVGRGSSGYPINRVPRLWICRTAALPSR